VFRLPVYLFTCVPVYLFTCLPVYVFRAVAWARVNG
jgi:hypothetical protein